MLSDIYETQRKKVEKLFHEHAVQQEAERAARFQFLKTQYGRAFPAPSGPVFLGGVRPTLNTAAYSKHTPHEIAVLQHEYAARAVQQAALDAEQIRETTIQQHLQQTQRSAFQHSIVAASEVAQTQDEREHNYHRAVRASHEASMHRAHKHMRY
jgi:hypothetical protein